VSVHADLARAVLAPASIALIGASADENKHASLPQRYLRRHGYAGRIYPINPTRESVFGERAYKRVRDVGEPVDHAFIMLPTRSVTEAVEDCCAAGVRCATILSNGFAESGPAGRERQSQLLDLARRGGLRLVGPNSLGIINLQDKVALSANEILSLPELRPGRHGLISQSGSLMGALLSRGQARGLGFSKLVSVGNEADLGVAEIGEMLIDDPDTDALLLFLETMRNPDGFAAMARRAFARGKPVVAYRLGRSTVGAQLAASHTGALTGDGAALDAFLRELGVVRVETLDALFEITPLLKGQIPVERRRATAVSTTGGGGALVIDNLDPRIELVPPSAEVVGRLAAAGIAVEPAPLVDLTLTGTNASTYGAVLTELMGSSECDIVIAVVGSSSQFRPDRAVAPIADAVAKGSNKPLAVYLTPQADASLALLADAGIAAFRTPESCADAVRAFLDWRRPTPAPAVTPERLRVERPAGALAPADAARVFAALGVPTVSETVLPPDPLAWDPAAFAGLQFPVVAKVLSRDIQHKTEVGGVVTDIETPEALRQACLEIIARVSSARPDAAVEGIQVQPMARGLAEVLVGYRRDPTVGPTVTLAAGGVLAEVYRDFATRIAPVDEAGAHEMVAAVQGLAPIRGYRGLPKGDLDALARAVVCVSRLALLDGPVVTEAEINPLMVFREGEGVLAVDALILQESASC
jgi:acyl-CoA synthetase (NDP forming)